MQALDVYSLAVQRLPSPVHTLTPGVKKVMCSLTTLVCPGYGFESRSGTGSHVPVNQEA